MYFAVSLFVAAIVYVIIKGNHINKLKEMIPRNKVLAVTGGCIYSFATYFSTLSFKYLPASIAFTVTQMCAVWSVLIGVLIFKEIDFKKNWLRILAGIAFTLVGVLILLLA